MKRPTSGAYFNPKVHKAGNAGDTIVARGESRGIKRTKPLQPATPVAQSIPIAEAMGSISSSPAFSRWAMIETPRFGGLMGWTHISPALPHWAMIEAPLFGGDFFRSRQRRCFKRSPRRKPWDQACKSLTAGNAGVSVVAHGASHGAKRSFPVLSRFYNVVAGISLAGTILTSVTSKYPLGWDCAK